MSENFQNRLHNFPFTNFLMDDEDTPQLVLKTQGMRVDELSHVIFSKEFVDIFPETGEWSIKNISIFNRF